MRRLQYGPPAPSPAVTRKLLKVGARASWRACGPEARAPVLQSLAQAGEGAGGPYYCGYTDLKAFRGDAAALAAFAASPGAGS